MFGYRTLQESYCLKVGKVYLQDDPYSIVKSVDRINRTVELELDKRLRKPQLNLISFGEDELRAWHDNYKNVKRVQELLGGEIRKNSTISEVVE